MLHHNSQLITLLSKAQVTTFLPHLARAGFLFLFSIFFPFLSFRYITGIPEIVSATGTCWSFKGTNALVYMGSEQSLIESWFGDYWREIGYAGFDPSFLIAMLTVQILTVLFAAFAAFRVKPFWALLPAVFNVGTILFMWFFSQARTLRSVRVTGFQLGFWLAISSAVLFFAIFIVCLMWTRKK